LKQPAGLVLLLGVIYSGPVGDASIFSLATLEAVANPAMVQDSEAVNGPGLDYATHFLFFFCVGIFPGGAESRQPEISTHDTAMHARMMHFACFTFAS
jgi:hypothetical protein